MDDDSQYSYTPLSPNPSDPVGVAEKAYNHTAYDTAGHEAAYNKDVGSASNLMGPSADQQSPEDAALSARAAQIYGSNVNQISRQAKPMAVESTTQLQTQDLAHQAAIYSNQQSRAQINYQQASFARGAAIQMANLKNQLYSQLFGGVAQLAGSGMAAISKSSASGGSPTSLTLPTVGSQYESQTPSLGMDYGGMKAPDYYSLLGPNSGGGR